MSVLVIVIITMHQFIKKNVAYVSGLVLLKITTIHGGARLVLDVMGKGTKLFDILRLDLEQAQGVFKYHLINTLIQRLNVLVSKCNIDMRRCVCPNVKELKPLEITYIPYYF